MSDIESNKASLLLTECNSSHFFAVKLELFDGPIDLLLHLVKQNELPIEKISLAQVASQFSHCMQQMSFYDIDMAGEYLVIAATLLSIKSSILLNEPAPLVNDQDGNLIDPHEELLRRLREAAVYKEVSELLASRDLLHQDVFSAPGEQVEAQDKIIRNQAQDVWLLTRAFRSLVQKIDNLNPVLTISLANVSITQRMMELLETFKRGACKRSFASLLEGRPSVSQLVATFIALLELCKRQVILIEQEEVFDEIFIVLAPDGGEQATHIKGSEFDSQEGSPESEEEPGALANY